MEPPGGMLGGVEHGTPGYAEDKQQVLARLRRVEGQVRGLQRLIEEDTYCIDVLTQVAAVTKALQGVGVHLLEEHLRHCVAGAAADSERSDELVHEATKAVQRMLRT
jgi:CsoR family transcriptional regulator, copper-sensing transcriptional repressor